MNRFYIDTQTIPWEQISRPKVEAIVFRPQTFLHFFIYMIYIYIYIYIISSCAPRFSFCLMCVLVLFTFKGAIVKDLTKRHVHHFKI